MTGAHRRIGRYRLRRFIPLTIAALIAAMVGVAWAVTPTATTDDALTLKQICEAALRTSPTLSSADRTWAQRCARVAAAAGGVLSSPSGSPTPSASPSPTPSPGPSPSPSPSPTPVPTTPSPSPTPTPTPPGGGLNLPRIPWEGGSAYWARFPKAAAQSWDSPSFFPVADFIGQGQHAAENLSVGINTYMAIEHSFPLSTTTNTGMFVFPHQEEWTQADVGNDPRAVGWFISDECEMGYSGCLDTNDEYGRLAVQRSYVDKIHGYNDGRFTWANFGNGIARTFWAPNTMDQFVQSVDGASADKYAYTSPGVGDVLRDSPDWPAGANPMSAAAYGWQVDQMRRFHATPGDRPVWAFVEAGKPYLFGEPDATWIRPEQFEGAAWSAIIHEARGLAIFHHDNSGRSCVGDNVILGCPEARAIVIKVTADLRALAPVLNTQSYAWDFGPGTDTMLKTFGNSAFIFADIGLLETPGVKTFQRPPGISGTRVEVVGEDRFIDVTAGSFSDSFAAEYTHHIYRIAL